MGKALILVVDDLATERICLRKILDKNGFDVIEATNGKDGVELAKEKRPNLILMDVVMPDVNGFQALRMVKKKDSGITDIPVIMVTTKDRDPDKMNAQDNGAFGYVVKPASEAALMPQINSALSL